MRGFRPADRLDSLGHRVLIAAELQGLLEPDQLVGLDVTWLPAPQPTPPGDYVAIVPLLSRWVGGTELKHLPQLKIVANCAVGHDNVDVVAAELRGVRVTNTPDVLTDATADLTWALILACARRVVEGTALVRSGSWTGWHPELLLGIELRGRTLGLLGAGRGGAGLDACREALGIPPCLGGAPRALLLPRRGTARYAPGRQGAATGWASAQRLPGAGPPLTAVFG